MILNRGIFGYPDLVAIFGIPIFGLKGRRRVGISGHKIRFIGLRVSGTSFGDLFAGFLVSGMSPDNRLAGVRKPGAPPDENSTHFSFAPRLGKIP